MSVQLCVKISTLTFAPTTELQTNQNPSSKIITRNNKEVILVVKSKIQERGISAPGLIIEGISNQLFIIECKNYFQAGKNNKIRICLG